MSLSQWAGRLYSLDTLDTRFTTPAKTPHTPGTDPAISLPKETAAGHSERQTTAQGAKASKWRTPEFAVYGFIFVTVVPLMFRSVYDVSQREYFTTSMAFLY